MLKEDHALSKGIYQLDNGNRIKITKISDLIAGDGSKNKIVSFYFTKGGKNGSYGLILKTFIKYYIKEYGAVKV
jgi:hypothetical protein